MLKIKGFSIGILFYRQVGDANQNLNPLSLDFISANCNIITTACFPVVCLLFVDVDVDVDVDVVDVDVDIDVEVSIASLSSAT